jgi:hypothetical protein
MPEEERTTEYIPATCLILVLFPSGYQDDHIVGYPDIDFLAIGKGDISLP